MEEIDGTLQYLFSSILKPYGIVPVTNPKSTIWIKFHRTYPLLWVMELCYEIRNRQISLCYRVLQLTAWTDWWPLGKKKFLFRNVNSCKMWLHISMWIWWENIVGTYFSETFLPASLSILLFCPIGGRFWFYLPRPPYVSIEVITHFVRVVVISKVEDYDPAGGLISLSRCILSKRDTVFNANVPPYSEEGRHG